MTRGWLKLSELPHLGESLEATGRGIRRILAGGVGVDGQALEDAVRRHPAGRARTSADRFVAERSTRYGGAAARLAASGWSLEEARRAGDAIDRLAERLELPPLTPWQRLVLEDLGVANVQQYGGAWAEEAVFVVDVHALADEERRIAEGLRSEVDALADTPAGRVRALADLLALLAGSYLNGRVVRRVAVALALVVAVVLGASGCKGTNPETPVTGTAPAPAAPAVITEG